MSIRKTLTQRIGAVAKEMQRPRLENNNRQIEFVVCFLQHGEDDEEKHEEWHEDVEDNLIIVDICRRGSSSR